MGQLARIAFGTLPDYADNPKGFRINGVSKGSTAEAIGLQAGDILTAIGDQPITRVDELLPWHVADRLA